MSTSVNDTPIVLHLLAVDVDDTASGVSARKLVNSPMQARRLVAFGGHDVVGCCPARSSRPTSPRSWIMILKPPAVPSPSTGGAPKMLTTCAPWHFLGEALLQLAAIASLDSSGSAVRSKSSSIRYIAPKLERVGVEQRSTGPEMATVCLTPGVSRAMSLDLLHHGLGASGHRRGVGQLHVDQQITLVLLRNEAGRRVREAHQVSTSRPP